MSLSDQQKAFAIKCILLLDEYGKSTVKERCSGVSNAFSEKSIRLDLTWLTFELQGLWRCPMECVWSERNGSEAVGTAVCNELLAANYQQPIAP